MPASSPPAAVASASPHADPQTRQVLRDRLAGVARRLAAREQPESDALDRATRQAHALHALVAEGLAAFHAALAEAGVAHLRIELGTPRTDDKHLHSVQFDLRRGRHVGIVTVKSRGDVTLVGPFKAGKVEGPCKSFPFAAESEIEAALGEFLEQFLAEAAAP